MSLESNPNLTPDSVPAPSPDLTPAPDLPPTPPKPEPKVVTKELFDKTASELAAARKQLKERMSADELTAATTEETRLELETLRREKQADKLEKALLKGGIKNSAEIADMFAAGETDKAISTLLEAAQAENVDLRKKLIVAEQRAALAPPVGEPNDPFAGKGVTELMQMANANPEMLEQILAQIDKMTAPKLNT